LQHSHRRKEFRYGADHRPKTYQRQKSISIQHMRAVIKRFTDRLALFDHRDMISIDREGDYTSEAKTNING